MIMADTGIAFSHHLFSLSKSTNQKHYEFKVLVIGPSNGDTIAPK